MAAVISDLLVTLFVIVFGVALGWCLRLFVHRDAAECGPVEEVNPEVQRAKEMVARLQELAASVAAEVGQHSQRVEQINEELTASQTTEAEAVVGAVAKLLQTNRQMQHRLASAEERLQDQARQIESQATAARTDALTGLANRRALDDVLVRRLDDFQRLHQPFWLMMFDVDHFKRFNDTHGHQAGDEVLRGVARVLRANAQNGDLVARYGGEEMVVVFNSSKAQAMQKATRIRQAIEQSRFRFEGIDLRVTVSVGLAEIAPAENAAALVRRADAALYASKDAGRNCAHWHDGREIHPIQGESKPGTEHSSNAGRDKASSCASPPAARGTRPAESATPPDDAAEPSFQAQPGLANRTAFCTMVSSRLAEWRRGGVAPGILLMQIDHYAEIAGRGDHQFENVVLPKVTSCLLATLREMDMVAHYDRAVFAAILPGAELAAGVRVAERLRKEIAACVIATESGPLALTASIGGAQPTAGEDGAQLLRRGEEALEAAGRAGGNCCYFHDGTCSQTVAAALGSALTAGTM